MLNKLYISSVHKKSSLFFGFFNFIFEWKCDNIEHSKSIKFIQMLNYGDTLNVCCFKIYCKLHLQCFRQGVTEKLFSNSLQVKSITHPFGWPFFDDLQPSRGRPGIGCYKLEILANKPIFGTTLFIEIQNTTQIRPPITFTKAIALTDFDMKLFTDFQLILTGIKSPDPFFRGD